MNRLQALTDIVLALALTVAAGYASARLVGAVEGTTALGGVIVVQGLIILIGLRLLLVRRRQGWRDIGLVRFAAVDIGRGVRALLLVIAVNVVLTVAANRLAPALVTEHTQRLQGFAAALTGGMPFAVVTLLAVFIGIYEELLARGLLLRRALLLLPGTWGPVLFSAVIFGAGHIYQGWVGVMQTTAVGLVLATLSLRWGSLWPAIIAHAALNTWSLGLLRLLEQGHLSP
ncbi:MAG: CPBP family intramembrane metalloprotease [Ectothiorhodospiraceae bacterium]